MVYHFPEIDDFFRQDYFTEENLNDLKSKLQESYLDREVFSKALSLIDLYLVKFKLSTPKELEQFKKEGIEKNKTRRKRNKAIYSGNLESKKRNIKESRINEGKYNKEYLEFLKIPISKISIDLDISISFINKVLESKKIDTIEEGFLSREQFAALKEILVSKLKAKIRKQKQIEKVLGVKIIKANKHKPKTGGKVYEALSKHGMGKVIYIRSK